MRRYANLKNNELQAEYRLPGSSVSEPLCTTTGEAAADGSVIDVLRKASLKTVARSASASSFIIDVVESICSFSNLPNTNVDGE